MKGLALNIEDPIVPIMGRGLMCRMSRLVNRRYVLVPQTYSRNPAASRSRTQSVKDHVQFRAVILCAGNVNPVKIKIKMKYTERLRMYCAVNKQPCVSIEVNQAVSCR